MNLWFCLTVKRLSDTADRTVPLVRCSIHYDSNKLAFAAEQHQKEEDAAAAAAARSWRTTLERAMLQEVEIRQQQTAPSRRKKREKTRSISWACTHLGRFHSQPILLFPFSCWQATTTTEKHPRPAVPHAIGMVKGQKTQTEKKLNTTR